MKSDVTQFDAVKEEIRLLKTKNKNYMEVRALVLGTMIFGLSAICHKASAQTVANPYLDVQGPAYTREHIYTLNKAGTAWLAWATRNTSGTDTRIDLSYIKTLSTSDFIGIGMNPPWAGYKLAVYNPGGMTGVLIGGTATNQTSLAFGTSSETNGHVFLQSTKAAGVSYGNIILNENGGSVGIGLANPSGKLHLKGVGTPVDANNTNIIAGDLVVQANTGGRTPNTGAALEFVIPANTDGSNLWGQGRIISVAGSTNSGDASGKMILGTRRYFDKLGAGQQWYYGDDITIDAQGRVGIGEKNPLSKFHVKNGNIMVTSPQFDNINLVLDASSVPVMRFSRWTGGSIQHNAYVGQVFNTETQDYAFEIGVGSSSSSQTVAERVITIPLSKNVGIGTNTPDEKLTVKGKIHTQEVRVDLAGAVTPDYVFERSYDLLSLKDLEVYINANKHLPEVPSAKEMEAVGMNLKEMNLILLKKVEELTLHLIETRKIVDAQQTEIENLKKK